MTDTFPGLIPDPRSEEAKKKDYTHDEVAPMAVLLKWDRGIEGAPIYSDRDQDGSGSCVCQGGATGLETITGQIISAHPPYSKRANFPTPGMWLQDYGNIIKNLGTTTEALSPSQKMTESEMNQPVTVTTPINGYLYAFPNFKDIDQLAQAIEIRKHCLITINGNSQEYAYSEKPVAVPNAKLDCPHCICGIYYFTDVTGEKCILIKESWGSKNIRLRVLTETYLNMRATGAMYFIPPVTPEPLKKPQYTFSLPLLFGQSNYGIKVLQDILKYESLFPINIDSTGLYKAVTAKAVLKWQKIHKVDSDAVLDALGGRRVGSKTIAMLNSIYH